MALVNEQAYRPSLRRLQSLDADYENLEERLHQAARIAGLPGEFVDEKNRKGQTSSLRKGGHSRAEWVLKWILDKLKSKDVDIGAQSRALPASWSLLTELVAFVPASNAARALNSGDILLSIQKALDERVLAEEPPPANGASPVLPLSQPMGVVSKKRKRKDIFPEKAEESLAPLATFYKSILKLLEEIAARTQTGGPGNDGVGRQHLASVLRTNTILAAQLLRSWMILTRHLMSNENSKSIISLSPILSIWNSRSIAVDDELGNSCATFSSECVEPTTLLYAALLKQFENAELFHERCVQTMIRDVETLLAEHVLVPARSAFFTAQQQNTARRYMIHLLVSNLSPLAKAISSYRDQSSPDLGLLLEVIPHVFGLAVTRSPRSTPKQQAAEAIWLEACLDALAGSVGQPISDDFESFSSDAVSEEVESPLEVMLKLAKDRSLTLSSEFLFSVLARHSGLVKDVPSLGSYSKQPSTHTDVRWFLVARIFDLDSDIFLGGTDSMLAPTSTSKNSQLDFAKSLIARISSMRWDNLETIDTNTTNLFSQDRNYFVSEIVIRLMNAFAKGRDLAGFMLLWFTEVSTFLVERISISEQSTVWTSEHLIRAFGLLLETSLTPAQVADLLEQYAVPLGHMVKECDSKLSESTGPVSLDFNHISSAGAASSASLMLLAILTGMERDETLSKCKTSLNSLSTLLRSLLQFRIAGFKFESRTWRLVTRIFQLLTQLEDSEELFKQGAELLGSDLLQVAQESIESYNQKHPEDGFDTCYEAFVFLAANSASLNTRGLLMPPKVLEKASQDILSINEKQASQTYNSGAINQTDGNLLSRLQDLALTLPYFLVTITSDQRRVIFMDALRMAVSIEDESSEEPVVRRSRLRLEALQEAIVNLASFNVLSDWLSVLLSALDSIKEVPQKLALANQAQVESLLLKMDPSGIPRNRSDGFYNREGFIDRLLNHLHPSHDRCMRTLSVIAKLMRVPNPTSKLGSDPAALWEVATYLNNYTWTAKSDSSLLQVFEAIATSVFNQADTDSLREQSERYFEKSNALAKNSVSEATLLGSFKKSLGTLALLKSRLAKDTSTHSRNRKGTEGALGLDQHCIQAVEALLCLDLSQISKSAEVDTDHVVFPAWSSSILSAAACFVTISDNSDNSVMTSIRALAENWSAMMNSTTAYPTSEEGSPSNSKFEWTVFAKALSSVLPSMEPSEVLSSAANLLAKKDLPIRDQRAVIDSYRHWSKNSISATQRLELIQSMATPDSAPALKNAYVQLRRYIISDVESQDFATDDIRKQAKSILPRLSRELEDAESMESFGNTLTIINRILRHKPFMVSQFGIERLLSTLTKISSSRSKALPRPYGDSIYLRLCQTTNTLIDVHRKQLGGRFHVLIPLLQALLTCLFVPHTNAKLSITKSPPPWLSSLPGILTGQHGIAYTRILTTLTQPTVSSATGTRAHFSSIKTPGLVDQTRMARQYAAQFVPYILLHFCSMQLVGRLNNDVRNALMPGLWACIDSVPREALRGMSSGMGRGDREIWSSLWAEWVRVNGQVG